MGRSRRQIVRVIDEGALAGALAALGPSRVVALLAERPVSCPDVQAEAQEAHAAGELLVVDATVPTLAGADVVRLGADVAFEQLGEGGERGLAMAPGIALVAAAGDAGEPVRGLLAASRAVADADGLEALLAEREASRRAAADNAQVVAAYLVCHPRVAEVRYPGLRGDPSFSLAASTLRSGFGPVVDFRLAEDASNAWQRVCCAAGDPRDEVVRLERDLLA